MVWKEGSIDDCILEPLSKYHDDRGWLGEFFRKDELDEKLHPVMGYISNTKPGIARGPHEHRSQTDIFVFFSGQFRVYLWDTRPDSATFGTRHVFEAGAQEPCSVIVPPGVVHAYRNVGDSDALILNCPNQLYAGWGKTEIVDEIRHENRTDGRFDMD